MLGVDLHVVHHGEEQVRHRRLLAVDDPAAGDEGRKVVVTVPVAVGQACAVDDDRVIELSSSRCLR